VCRLAWCPSVCIDDHSLATVARELQMPEK
jgi:hypothetical protein